MPSPKVRESHYSYADYLAWDDGQRWELIDGEATCMSPAPTLDHQAIVTELVAQLATALRGKPCQPFASPVDVRLAAPGTADDRIDRVVQPDVLVVCDPSKLDRRGVVGAPDLIVEVVSPGTASYDHVKKRRLYESAGVREFWLVHPADRIVVVYTLGSTAPGSAAPGSTAPGSAEYGRPEVAPMQGQTPVQVLPGVSIDWEPVLERLGPAES